MVNSQLFLLGVVSVSIAGSLNAQPETHPAPDARMKADILLVVAHPDDETAIGSYLAKTVFDERRKVAIVYCNRGSGGGNSYGMEQAEAMGYIREIEARQSAAAFGITNVWFLNGRDTPGQDVFRSLQRWGHGSILEDVVRIVRLTRPEVIFTWLPDVVAGENHGDHQAAGILAVEAFDCAGDPTVFPAQVTAPRERTDIDNATEGLRVWQPKKIYFFSDASDEIVADGPAFNLEELSPSKQQPYYMLAGRLHVAHLTQGDVSQVAIEAFRTGDFSRFKKWLGKFRLIFGKSVVSAAAGGDVFDGIDRNSVPFTPPPAYVPALRRGFSFGLGGSFAFYQEFWRAHELQNLSDLVPPELEVTTGSYLHVPLQIHNSGQDSLTVTLTSALEEGWKEISGSGTYRVPPCETYPVEAFVLCPASITTKAVAVRWDAAIGNAAVGSAVLRVSLVEWSLPQ